MVDVTPARGVLLSEAAAREVVAALDHLNRLAAPRGMQLSQRLRAIRRELATSTSHGGAHATVSECDSGRDGRADWEPMLVDSASAARELGITPGGVAWLCRNGRLTATRSGGRWLIDTVALRSYKTIRKGR